MPKETTIQEQIAATIALLRTKLGVRGKTLAASLRRAKHLLPRRVYTQAMKLAQAEQMMRHPKLRLTLDTPQLTYAAQEVQAHLHAIDLADRRWGAFLGVLAGIAANMLMLAVLVFILLWWRGLI
ncbi:hypothetical protein AVO45_11070 [Ruegeria marisrubri]|uniref:Uncharacterized protein n=1 Tax=Ruegeria marisrubri TaxID=1685379 RepID=A0A0X3TML2_9RHOB|nr:hypothetical protein [Ruegeria marisrubri]KUJ77012.1 hypothetical protein AVO45_11070 [Ruegeria marisrubri]